MLCIVCLPGIAMLFSGGVRNASCRARSSLPGSFLQRELRAFPDALVATGQSMTYQAKRPLWKCPKCGARFVIANMWHSCGKYSLRELFSKSDPHVFRLFRKFERLVRACGRVTMIPQKTRVVFMERDRFAGAYPRKSYLICGIGLPRKIRHPKLVKYEAYAPHFRGHLFRIELEKDFDADFAALVHESYGVGTQEYLKKEKPSYRRRP